jgi:hypothetical protein
VDQLAEGSDRDPKETLRLREGDLNDPVRGSQPVGWGSASSETVSCKETQTMPSKWYFDSFCCI